MFQRPALLLLAAAAVAMGAPAKPSASSSGLVLFSTTLAPQVTDVSFYQNDRRDAVTSSQAIPTSSLLDSPDDSVDSSDSKSSRKGGKSGSGSTTTNRSGNKPTSTANGPGNKSTGNANGPGDKPTNTGSGSGNKSTDTASGSRSKSTDTASGSSASGNSGPFKTSVSGKGNANATATDGGVASPTPAADSNGFHPVTPCKAGGGPTNCGDCFPSQAIDPLPLANANLSTFDNSNFVTVGGGGGGQTWFSVPQPKAGCKVLFFGQTPGMAAPRGVPGIMTAIADTAGCYFVNTANKISVNYCCGDDECESIGAGVMGTAPPSRKRSVQEFRAEVAGQALPAAVIDKRVARTRLADTEPIVSVVSVEKRDTPVPNIYAAKDTFSAQDGYTAPPAGPNTWCEPAQPKSGSQTYGRAGTLQLVGNREKCTGTFCSFGISASMSSGTTLDVTGSEDDTSSHGINWSGTVGYQGDFAPTMLFTAGGDKSWSTAITNSTSTSNSTTTESEISDSLGVQYGTWAQLGLVAQLNCNMFVATCHNGTTTTQLNIEKCTPIANSTNPKAAAYLASPVNFGL